MNSIKLFDPNRKTVKDCLAQFGGKNDDVNMPELLSKLSPLLEEEKEDWAGVAAMRLCIQEFSNNFQPRPLGSFTHKDFANRVFSPNHYVPMGVSPERLGESENIPQAPAPPENPTILKVKIYLGSIWNLKMEDEKKVKGKDEKGDKIKGPSLLVKLNIEGGTEVTEPKETKLHTKTSIPCWNQEITLPLSRQCDNTLIVEVYERKCRADHKCKRSCSKNDSLVCTNRGRVAPVLRQGLHVISLFDPPQRPSSSSSSSNSTWLFVRLMLEIEPSEALPQAT